LKSSIMGRLWQRSLPHKIRSEEYGADNKCLLSGLQRKSGQKQITFQKSTAGERSDIHTVPWV